MYEKTTHNEEQLATTINAVIHAVILYCLSTVDHLIISVTICSSPVVDSTVLLSWEVESGRIDILLGVMSAASLQPQQVIGSQIKCRQKSGVSAAKNTMPAHHRMCHVLKLTGHDRTWEYNSFIQFIH